MHVYLSFGPCLTIYLSLINCDVLNIYKRHIKEPKIGLLLCNYNEYIIFQFITNYLLNIQ